MRVEIPGQLSIFDLDIWSGRMSPEPSQVTEEKISGPSSKKPQKWQKGMPMYLDLRGGGNRQDVSWEMGGALPGEYTMHSFGESPSAGRESHLSQILEVAAPQKYYLSARACLGILRRAEKRGKKLPRILEMALRRQAGVLVSRNEPENQGGGKGILIQNDRTGALSTLNNQPVCYGVSSYDSNAMKSGNPYSGIYKADTARTLDLNGGNPACNQGGMIVLEGNGSRESHRGDGYAESDVMYTLNTIERHGVPYVLNDQGGSQMSVSEGISGTLRSEEHGHQPLVLDNHPADSRITICEDGIVPTIASRMGTGGNNGPLIYESSKAPYHQRFSTDGKAETLVASDYKDPPIAVDCRNMTEDEISGSLQSSACHNLNSNNVCRVGTVVRRLTPMECERLQAFPDWWTDIGEWVDSKGKIHKNADSPRYKALGNSIALPFWEWMAERMCQYIDKPTMASLFDGIGGFPLVFSRCGCTPVWCSEIEEFPIAVTKIRFQEV